jgi:hypothetical protein
MLKLHRPQPRVTVAQLMKWAKLQVEQGAPRQAICEGWLRQDRTTLTPEERVVFEQAERQLFCEMVDRDLRGADLEKRGLSADAIAEYEANVKDQFLGAHTYERLQALYLAQGDYDNALRISRIHVRLLARSREVAPTWEDEDEFDGDVVAPPLPVRLRLVKP